MTSGIEQAGLDCAFYNGRTYGDFSEREVSDDTLRQIYDAARWAPTSMNAQPARYIFLKSKAAKEKLASALAPGNLEKTRKAPVTVIVASDTRFYEHLPMLFPAYDAQPMFMANPALSEATAFRNSTLQGAYFIIAARLFGVQCGPMSGFDPVQVDAAFFPEGRFKTNFLINLGYAAPNGSHARGPRLTFDEVAKIL